MKPRQPAPEEPPVALTIAGSDSGGGAGIQADLKTMEACGAFGTSAITSVTAQNTQGVRSTQLLPVAEIRAQVEAVLSDFDVRAAKTGMLATGDVVELVTEYADEVPHLVVDPVMVAATGDRLLEPEAEQAYEGLVAESALVTPNADEAAVLTGIDPEDEHGAREAGEQLVGMGADAALVKGGHVPGETVVDVLVTEDAVETFRHDRVADAATHGSGCTLSSAIAAWLATGLDLTAAVTRGIELLTRAVRYPLDVGEGPGSVHHLVEVRDRAAREPTAEAVETVVQRFVETDVSPLVPAGGMNVVGATPYAEVPAEAAAVEGRITRTVGGVRPNRGVRFGASSTVARFLLACREVDPAMRFAVDCRFDEDVEAALAALDGPVVEVSRADADGRDDRNAGRVRDAVRTADATPVAVVDRDGGGTGPTVKLLAADAGRLGDRTCDLLDELR